MKNLVLLWGWNRNETTYRKLVELAPQGWQIHQISYPDLIPHGKLSELHQNLEQFLDQKKLDKVYLLGHSLGGALALAFAATHPERITKLFLADSAGVYDQRPAIKAFFGVTFQHHDRRYSWKEKFSNLYRSLSSPVTHARLAYLAHHIDLQAQAAELKVPTLIMWGATDQITPVWQGRRLNQLISGSELIVFDRQGHDWIVYRPELLWQNIS